MESLALEVCSFIKKNLIFFFFFISDTLYSHSSRLMRVNGHMLPYAWNHTVSYDQSHGVMPFLVEKLTTKNIHAARDSSGKKVQFSVVSQISRGIKQLIICRDFFMI